MKINKGRKKSPDIFIVDTPKSIMRNLDSMLDDIASDYARIFTKRLNYSHTTKWFVFDKNWMVKTSL